MPLVTRSLCLVAFALATLSGVPVALAAPAGAVVARIVLHPPVAAKKKSASTQIKHIVLIIQENRTVDNLFNGFCTTLGCADTVTIDPKTGTQLQPYSLSSPFDPPHAHSTFVTQYDNGKMDGFGKTPVVCQGNPSLCPPNVYVYVPATETQIYRTLATIDGGMSDQTFQTDEGPSFPSHLYAIAGQSGGYDADHWAIDGGSGNCGITKPMATQVLMTTKFPGQTGNEVPPCKDFETVLDLLANAGHTWRYYSDSTAGFFSAPQAIQHLYNSPNFFPHSTQFLTDVSKGILSDVTFVIPHSEAYSDHPGHVPANNPEAGPEWVASLVNAIGETPFWSNTAIVIWWDDWGGLYDHVRPPRSPVKPDPFEYGFRVPLLVASPYAQVGVIDHTKRTFVSALRLVEETFKLPSLGTTDQYEPDGLDSMFNWNQTPTPYTPLGGSNSRPFINVR
jgi:phospholipase C